jgi:hypothetical protein
VIDVDGWPSGLPAIRFEGSDLGGFLSKGILGIQDNLSLQPNPNIRTPTSFDVLHPKASFVYVSDQSKLSNWNAALEKLGTDLRDSRRGKPPDHDGVLNVIRHKGAPPTVKRAAFGLPLQFYYRGYHEEKARRHPDWSSDQRQAKRKTRYLAIADVTPSGDNVERRASPLHFKVAWVGKEHLGLVVTFFNAQFLPEIGMRISPRDRNAASQTVSAPDYSAIREFLSRPMWHRAFGADNKTEAKP